MEKCIQKFLPSLKINTGIAKQEIKERIWIISKPVIVDNGIQEMGYMGQYQIEEVWKHYAKTIYVSNYGYVARIDEEKARTVFGSALLEKLQSVEGAKWRKDLNTAQKDLIRACNKVPTNKKYSGCQIWLQIDRFDIHKMVAEKFMEKPEGDGWAVHHIDNNSYNNSVTNLIWLKNKEEHWKNHSKLHPMSR